MTYVSKGFKFCSCKPTGKQYCVQKNSLSLIRNLSYFNSKPYCSSIQYININTFKTPLTEQNLMFSCKASSPKVPCPLYKSRITLANTWYCTFNGDVFRSIRLRLTGQNRRHGLLWLSVWWQKSTWRKLAWLSVVPEALKPSPYFTINYSLFVGSKDFGI